MASRKPLRAPVVPAKDFLDGAPIDTVEQPAKAAAKPKREPKPKAAKPVAHAPDQLDLVLTDVEAEPSKLVSMKIPLKLYEGIDKVRRNSRLTLTDIFVKSAEPQVARLLAEIEGRKAR